MKVYTYSEARQRLATLLEEASKQGAVGIRRRDGGTYVIRPEPPTGSPLDVVGVDLSLGTDEILAAIREGRRSNE